MSFAVNEQDSSYSMGVSELRYARSVVSFPTNLMGQILHSGPEAFRKKLEIDRIVGSYPSLSPSNIPFLSRSDRYRASLQVAHDLLELRYHGGEKQEQQNQQNQQNPKHQQWTHQEFAYALVSTAEWHAISLQEVYLAALTSNADEQQLKKYLPPSSDFRIIGCYAQTELAHGSNVKGLQTLATYIPETDEFNIHTPTVEATKWWVGALGKSATHAIVFARLILNEQDLGVHSFMVPLRCPKTHKPFPGITVGDLGPKMGFSAVDNGWMRFNNVRIPRTEMLGRFSRVLAGGIYEKPQHAKLGYGGMTAVRANIAMMSGSALARAATVAVRYSLVRRQSPEKNKNGQETQILDYSIQQYRLFPQIANAYALHFAGFF